jgi:hypothetical protein
LVFLVVGEPASVIRSTRRKNQTPLVQVSLAGDCLCLSAGALQTGQQYRHEQGDYGDYHQKLY